MWFFFTPPVFHWVFANVNARSPLAGIIRVLITWDVTIRRLIRSPRHTAHYAALRSRAARSCTCAPRNKKNQYEIRVFSRMRFSCQKPEKLLVFSGSVNGATKNLGFLYFGSCQCKWALYPHFNCVIHLIWNSLFFLLCHSFYIYSTFFIISLPFSQRHVLERIQSWPYTHRKALHKARYYTSCHMLFSMLELCRKTKNI